MSEARVKFGSTRIVILVGNIAVKFPALDSWEHFLLGIVSNIRESHYWKWFKCARLCPVLFSAGGFILIMQRAEELSPDEFSKIELGEFVTMNNARIPVEDKFSSFGKIGMRIVATDYGN